MKVIKAIIRKIIRSIFHKEIVLVPSSVVSKGVNIFSYIYENNVWSYKLDNSCIYDINKSSLPPPNPTQ
jgi:hypothetical protein